MELKKKREDLSREMQLVLPPATSGASEETTAVRPSAARKEDCSFSF